MNYDEILKRITFGDSYGDFCIGFLLRMSLPLTFIYLIIESEVENGTPLNNDNYEFKEIYQMNSN